MKRTLMVLALALAATPVWASSITVVSSTPGAGWQPVGTINQNGTRYWDNPSWDSAACNIGHVLTGTQTCGPNIPGGPLNAANLVWWGLASGAADPSFLFSSPSAVRFTDLFSVTGLSIADVLGWYDPASSATGSAYGPLNSPGDTVQANPPATFGLYLNNGSTVYKTGAAGNRQQFVVFQDLTTANLYIGAEDLPSVDFAATDYDYNDRDIEMHAAPAVPEPGTLVLLGTGLLGSVRFLRRRKTSGSGR